MAIEVRVWANLFFVIKFSVALASDPYVVEKLLLGFWSEEQYMPNTNAMKAQNPRKVDIAPLRNDTRRLKTLH
jgi:hypothetical protein